MSKPAKARNRAGRPGNRSMQFGARLLSIKGAYSENHSRHLLREEGFSHLSATDWYVVARAIELGMETSDDFEDFVRHAHYVR